MHDSLMKACLTSAWFSVFQKGPRWKRVFRVRASKHGYGRRAEKKCQRPKGSQRRKASILGISFRKAHTLRIVIGGFRLSNVSKRRKRRDRHRASEVLEGAPEGPVKPVASGRSTCSPRCSPHGRPGHAGLPSSAMSGGEAWRGAPVHQGRTSTTSVDICVRCNANGLAVD